MAVKFTNNAATTLAAGINSSVTSISVTDGSVFPALTGSDHFYVTFDDTTNREIVKVTARSGNTLTVVRGQDNTTAQAFNSGDKAELRVVAALLEDITTEVTSTLSVDTFTGDGTTTAFTLSQAPSSEDNLIVFIEGTYQNPGDFVLSGTTLTLDEAPVEERNIIVYHVKGAVSGNNLNQDSFTADGNTAAFTLSIAPIHENNTQVFIDGVYQQKNSYSISGTTLTLDANPSNGATVEVMTFTQTEVNTLPASFVSGLTEVTAVGADHFMIFDATDSALKKSLVSDVLESATSISTSADATAITIDSSENVTFTNNVTINSGQLTAGGLAYPTSDGTNGQVLTTNGSGTLSFTTIDTSISANSVGITELDVSDGTNGQVLTTDGAGTLSFSTISGYTDSDVETYLNTSEIYTDATNNRLGIGASSPTEKLSVLGGHISVGDSTGVAGTEFLLEGYREIYNGAKYGNTSIRTTYDIGSNASDMLFYTASGGTNTAERMRIASNGDVQLQGGNQMTNAISWWNAATYELASIENVSHPSYNDSGGLVFKTAGLSNSGMAERMRIDSAGRVGIGTDDPSSGYGGTITAAKLALLSGTAGSDGGSSTLLIGGDNKHYAYMQGRHTTGGATELDLGTASGASNPTVKVRIKPNGEFMVGTTNLFGGGNKTTAFFGAKSDANLRLLSANNGGYACLVIHNTGLNTVGSITQNGSNASFNTSSDYRLKENVNYTWDATTRFKQLKPARFNWIRDETNTLQDGFLAHEVEDIVPEAVKGTKDEVKDTISNVVLNASSVKIDEDITEEEWIAGKEDGTYEADTTWVASYDEPMYQQIDHSKLVPLLVKTIQELEARITTLENA